VHPPHSARTKWNKRTLKPRKKRRCTGPSLPRKCKKNPTRGLQQYKAGQGPNKKEEMEEGEINLKKTKKRKLEKRG